MTEMEMKQRRRRRNRLTFSSHTQKMVAETADYPKIVSCSTAEVLGNQDGGVILRILVPV